MRDLDQIQRWLQAVITNLDGVRAGVASEEARAHIDVEPEQVEQVVTRSQALTGLERLDIYYRAYYARLVECLREEFPVLLHALGEDAFDQFAVAYLQQYPSRSYTLNQLGANFPRYLAESRPAASVEEGSGPSWPDFLIDLVTLELTYGEVFDGPGVEGQPLLDAAQLAAIPAERWPEARLVPVCCLRLLALHYPVHQYHSAVRKNRSPSLPDPADTFLAITRRRYVIRRFELSRPQYLLLSALLAGQPVGAALAAAAAEAGPDVDLFAASLRDWFQLWTTEGFFQTVQLAAIGES